MTKIQEVIKLLKRDYEIKATEFGYVFNNIISIPSSGGNVYVIPEKKKYNMPSIKILDFAREKLCIYSDEAVFEKKGIKGILYPEFKNKKENSCFSKELYHWNIHKSEFSESHLYFLIHEDKVKIGQSKSLDLRIKTLKTGLSSNFSVFVGYHKGFMEKKLHKYFCNINTNGEWFYLNERIHSFLKKADLELYYERK